MLRSDLFYKENILDRSDELSVMLTELEDTGQSQQSGSSLPNRGDISIGRSETGVYYISDIHLDHKIYKKFGKHGSLPKITKYIEEIVDELLKDDDENELFYPIQSVILILGDTSHSLVINKLFYEALSSRLPYHRDVFVTLGNHELWEYNSVDEALLAYDKLFDELPNIHLLHNSLYANNLYEEPNELVELRQQKWQVFKDETLSERAKAKAIKEIEKQIDLVDPQYGLSEEERHKSRVKASIISQDALQAMTIDEIRGKCFDSKMIIFGAIGYSQYDEKYNANIGMYMNAITTRDREGKLSKEAELIHKKLVESLPNNHLLIATHMPLRCWSKAQPHEG